MLRRLASRVLIRHAIRPNYSLRTPIEEFRNCEFVTNQPNPFHTEKRVVSGSPDITVITRPALHGAHCTIGIIIPSGSRNGINMPSGNFTTIFGPYRSKTDHFIFLESNF